MAWKLSLEEFGIVKCCISKATVHCPCFMALGQRIFILSQGNNQYFKALLTYSLCLKRSKGFSMHCPLELESDGIAISICACS